MCDIFPRHFVQTTGAVFPTGFLAVLSGAMLLFYLYNMAAGGNPPPKKGVQPKAA